ncbi:Fluoride export protein 1 [Curvularia clavata]|uniref:Fluoride export protein 1 n=1 Tax=Curvularia clavata TaxID=95742 RepID=A0A9Q9DV87_CURCL|nr:Fluoride export protein 1 [Curvularia clavata]
MADHAATASPTTIVGDDDGPTKRETHYNNQRSSLRSSLLWEEPSAGPRSQSQTHSSAARINDLDFDDIDPSPPSPGSTASPAPNIPYARDRHRTDSGSKWKDRSSSKHTSRTTADYQLDKAHEAGDFLVPGSWLHVYTDAARAPDSPASLRKPRRQNAEADAEHVTPSPLRAHPSSTLSLPPQHLAPGPGSTSQLSITALPSMSPEKQDDYADLYMRSRPTPGARRASRLATELYTVSYLIFFSIWGTLARLGLQALTFYSGTPLTFSELWANVAGTLIMGFLAEDRRLFAAEWGYGGDSLPEPPDEPARRHAERARHGRVKKTVPMYIGLATGFCGSFTSFSSFIRDIFLALSNDLKAPVSHPYPANAQLPSPGNLVPRNGGYSFLALCATIIITIATCYCALHVGAHLALALDRITPTLSFRLTRRVVDPIFVVLGWGVWIGAVIMAVIPPKDAWRSQALFACVFAPIGCLLRYYVSIYLNPINPSFPVGTFTVNVFGTAVIGMAYDLQHVSLSTTGLVGGGLIGCQVLQGIMDGLCGCLTTVSTWIVEIDALKRKAAYVYASLSVVTAFSLLLIIMGSVRWTEGWEAILCAT